MHRIENITSIYNYLANKSNLLKVMFFRHLDQSPKEVHGVHALPARVLVVLVHRGCARFVPLCVSWHNNGILRVVGRLE